MLQGSFLLSHGGVSVYALLAISVLAVAIFFERLFVLRTAVVLPSPLIGSTHTLLLAGKLPEATQLCSSNHSPLAMLYAHILQRAQRPFAIVRETLNEQGSQIVATLHKRLWLLSTIAAIAPLLGILGTVLGMIQAFHSIAQQSFANPLQMAAGIWEALLSTAVGLIVGICCFVAHRFLAAKAHHLTLKLQHESSQVLELVFQHHRPARC
ncbi:MAG: MotA/TolQ/ExbB proton channel family protein [Myxococcota bacterium]